MINNDKSIKINETIDESIEHIFDKKEKDSIKNPNTKTSFFLDYNIARSYSDKNFDNNKKKLKKIPTLPIRKKKGFLFNNQLSKNSDNNSIISNINSLENLSLNNEDFKNTINKIKESHSKSMIKIEDSLNKKLNVIYFLTHLGRKI